eukprot:5656937-Lingulodinium_polyedra.AAC.1
MLMQSAAACRALALSLASRSAKELCSGSRPRSAPLRRAARGARGSPTRRAARPCAPRPLPPPRQPVA